jgi:hypothetical protein
MPAPAAEHQPATLTARQREDKAVSLRLGGATFEQIGQQLELTGPGARSAMLRGLRRHAKLAEEDADTLRVVELLRLDRAVTVATAIMLDMKAPADTKLRAVDRLIRAGERRCALLGLDAPKLHRIDLAGLTEDELSAIAGGRDPLAVLASRPLPPALYEPPQAPPADDADDDDAELGEVVGNEVVFA